jgi:hypothetical protein
MKFEYKVLTLIGSQQADDQIEHALNELGVNRWEVVASFIKTNGLYALVLKRPKE